MLQSHKVAWPVVLTFCLSAAACSSVEPVVYSGIASAPYLEPNRRDDERHVRYRYSARTDWRSYTRLIIDPVKIYRGPDHQFGDMSEADKASLADFMQRQFAEKLAGRYAVTSVPGPGVLRLKLTLTGAAASTPVASTLSRFDLAGGLYNGVQTVRGGEGLLTGSATYAVEIEDASTRRLLAAHVAKHYPSPIDIPASIGALSAARAGIENGAEALLAQLADPTTF
ncbi:DUF3313 domain-containing protein [Methylosinus sp. H3A]|uniref:DUF3313 domain-containing protein n=1 Tax=Methylosinus sp. H3A TaxID=2785786 RepID=UPI0018C2E3C4|nr:DUF3313 domain-containing protein [Methylosinus sp. H3A]MBG0812149.1 DUF3313 domain-containing protein [Methylosinus sp. H3A]